ncbi:MAG: nucleotidyl transferase AbiEii/AbiGii toxin family protein [Elusimicrobia bacterium]|nr:nucleotidyl transferase AbiEii/AbiGii toxin family protein [Elusimicrobiota bacterium]
MLRMIPHVSSESRFALKGGTAINFFLRDMPRLSVDIDLTYLPLEGREDSLKNIGQALKRIAVSIKKAMPGIKIQESVIKPLGQVAKLVVNDGKNQIKIEPNQIIRGTLFPCENHELSKKAEELFEISVSTTTLSEADIYGGKICAALDRQHPRDLFDIKILMDHEGITPEIQKAFVVYLSSHDRPMHEVIDPTRKDVRSIFENEFLEMTDERVTYEELVEIRENLVAHLKARLTDAERRFLISLKEGNPEWNFLGLEGIERLPAIQWKLQNIKKMDAAKHRESIAKLKAKLEM